MADVVRRQHSTPRVTGQIKVGTDTEMLENVVELIHEEIKCPELFGDVLGMRGLADSNLVVKYDWYVETNVEFFEREDIMMRETGTTMEHWQRPNARIEVTEDPVPRLVRFPSDTKVYLPRSFRLITVVEATDT